MFSKELVNLQRHPAARAAAAAPFGRLAGSIGAMAAPDAVEISRSPPGRLVHGYAALRLETSLEAS